MIVCVALVKAYDAILAIISFYLQNTTGLGYCPTSDFRLNQVRSNDLQQQ